MVKHAVRTAHVFSRSKFIYPCSVFVYANTCTIVLNMEHGNDEYLNVFQ